MSPTEITLRKMGAIGAKPVTSVMGKREPVAHPQNCRLECPYGKGRSFCFPCMAKILSERKSEKAKQKV